MDLVSNSRMGINTSILSSITSSNSVINKIAFTTMVVIISILILKIVFYMLGGKKTYNDSPRLTNGMLDAKHMKIIEQDPSKNKSVPILRSNNANSGIEFTWSVWIYVADLDYGNGTYRHIFHKGNNNINYTDAPTGLNFPNNGPGLYLKPSKNDLLIIMNTFDKIDEHITVEGIPIGKWVNVIIRTQNNTVDCYINGTITKRHKLSSVPFQNYGDVYMSVNGGFSGYTSNLWYYDRSIELKEIQKIVDKGPNTKLIDSDSTNINSSKPKYLSLDWYLNQ